MNWKTRDSHHLIQDKWISLRVDTCTMPNGTLIEPYYVFEYPTWVNVVAVTPDKEIVLVKMYRHGIGKVSIELPSGAMEPNDQSAIEAAKRELLEETGFGGGKFIQTGELSPNPATHTNITKTFLATDVEKLDTQKLDCTEDIEIVLLPMNQVFEKMQAGYFIQALHMGSLFYALSHMHRLEFQT